MVLTPHVEDGSDPSKSGPSKSDPSGSEAEPPARKRVRQDPQPIVAPAAEPAEARIQKALDLIGDYYLIPGQHRRDWVVDQAVRALCPDRLAYHRWVADHVEPDPEAPLGVGNRWRDMVADCIPP